MNTKLNARPSLEEASATLTHWLDILKGNLARLRRYNAIIDDVWTRNPDIPKDVFAAKLLTSAEQMEIYRIAKDGDRINDDTTTAIKQLAAIADPNMAGVDARLVANYRTLHQNALKSYEGALKNMSAGRSILSIVKSELEEHMASLRTKRIATHKPILLGSN
jgi:hypothetical protein